MSAGGSSDIQLPVGSGLTNFPQEAYLSPRDHDKAVYISPHCKPLGRMVLRPCYGRGHAASRHGQPTVLPAAEYSAAKISRKPPKQVDTDLTAVHFSLHASGKYVTLLPTFDTT
jgi:hypothetical protein